MAGKQISGEGLSSSMAGMSKSQLYDIMSQMKTLIEQNQQQARQILIQNPALTKALFQAQIMLGMVQAPQTIPNILPPVTQQQPQQSAPPPQQPSIQAAPSIPSQLGSQDQEISSQAQIPPRKQISTANISTQSTPSQSQQTSQQHKGHLNAQPSPFLLPQPSQIVNVPPPSLHSAPQPQSLLPPQMPPAPSTQMQQPPSHTNSFPNISLQPPLPPQPRPPSMMNLPHQFHSQAGPNVGFQNAGPPQLHPSQPMFHSGVKPPASIGPSFSQAQPPLPSQAPPQSLYQMGGSHLGADFNNQIERSSPWIPGLSDNTNATQFPHQMGAANQPPRPPQFGSDMEKALVQQVMNLTAEQINMLPPDQRHQIIQLQQLLRQ